jgi:hypothetical protein
MVVIVAGCWLLVAGLSFVIPAKAGIPAYAGMTLFSRFMIHDSRFPIHDSRFTIPVLLALLLAPHLQAQKNTGLLIPRDFGRYYVSDIYAPVSNLGVGLGTNSADYNTNIERKSDYIVLEDFTLGVDLPFYSCKFILAGKPVRVALTGSLSAMVLFDFTSRKSAPIINVDYRAGFPELHLLREFDSKRFRNVLLRFIPLQHESTHIGDELLLYREEAGFSIKRINVSYQSWETSLTLNDPAVAQKVNHSVSAGARFLYQIFNHRGYYSMRPVEGDPNVLVPSHRRMEWYLRYQLDARAGLFRDSRFYPVFSGELRYRVQYGYPYHVVNEKTVTGYTVVPGSERFAPCLNLYAGFRDRGEPGKPGWAGVYLRYYAGINPHGQFRNLPNYNFFGISLIFND